MTTFRVVHDYIDAAYHGETIVLGYYKTKSAANKAAEKFWNKHECDIWIEEVEDEIID